jgi:hypothetical protein
MAVNVMDTGRPRAFRTTIAAAGLVVAAAATILMWCANWLNAEVAKPAFYRIENEEERVKYLQSLQPKDIEEIVQYSRNVLAREPLNRNAVEALAIAHILRRNESATEGFITSAAQLSFRNSLIQFSAVAQLLNKREFKKAIYHADGLLRARPLVDEQVFRLFAPLLGNKDFVGELTQALTGNPPWRLPFINYLLDKGGGPRVANIVVAALLHGKFQVTDLELRNVIGRFVAVPAYDEAYFVWLNALSDQELKSAKGVFDGEFNLASRSLYFDWNFLPTSNTQIAIRQRSGNALNRNLVLEFAGETQRFAGVNQYMKLNPGRYLLTYESMSRNFVTDGGLAWRFFCMDEPREIARGPVHRGSGPWATYSFQISVPTEKCDTQFLSLETPSTSAIDARISGQFNVDSVVLESLN